MRLERGPSDDCHRLILDPSKDSKAFDRAYREEHLPYAAPLVGANRVEAKHHAPPRTWSVMVSEAKIITLENGVRRSWPMRPRGGVGCSATSHMLPQWPAAVRPIRIALWSIPTITYVYCVIAVDLYIRKLLLM